MPEIVLENLCKRYGDTVVADDIDMRIEDGEYVCILGPTGAGKTTMMRMICGLTEPDSGKVFLGDRDVTGEAPDARDATMLTQTYALFQHMTVYDNVMFAPATKEWPEADSKQIVRSMLHLVHLDQKATWMPAELSGGQQQRVALARALSSGSKVLLLDEPLRALDARLRIALRKEIRSIAKEMGLTCIHVTHDQDEALNMADRMAILRHGKVLQFDTPMEVFNNPATPFVANFVGRSNMIPCTVVGHSDGLTEVEASGLRLLARATDLPEGAEAVLAVKVGFTKLTKPDPEAEAAEDGAPEADGPGRVSARVERVLYEGMTITVDVEVDGIGTLSAKLPNRKYEDFAPGDTVEVSWPAEKASVFPMPEDGLEEELRLDRWEG